MSRILTNTTDAPIRYCFYREDSLVYVTIQLNPGQIPADIWDYESGWFDLLPGNQVNRCGAFSGINWEPVQTPIR